MRILPENTVRHSDTTDTELMPIPVQQKKYMLKRKLTLKASLEQRSQRLTIQVNCYQLDSVVCFLKVVFSALIHLLLNMVNLYKWGKHFCKLWIRTNCFLYQCKLHFLVPVSSRYVKLILTYGTQVQLFGTMLNDYTGEQPSYSKNISLSSKKVLKVKQRAFLFGSSKDKNNMLPA